jgi:23S rRNA (uracil-5-)-methyltransferase RumA
MEKKKLHRKKYRNIIDEIAEPFRGSAEPLCPYFGSCGGCLFQDIEYEKQLEIKALYLQKLFLEIPMLAPLLEDLKVKGSNPYGYRNRMDFVAAFGRRGLRERGRFRHVVDLDKCALMNERMNAVWQRIRAASAMIEDYDYLVHKGFLRYTVVRSAHFTGEIMLTIVATRDSVDLDPLVDAVRDHVDSLSLIVHDGLADLSIAPVSRDIKRGFIEENFDGTVYRITPNSFFQSNSRMALEMYTRITEETNGKVLDLFSGVGSISLFAAKKAEHVTGVEIMQESVDAAIANAGRNNVSNVDFICADALPYMKENPRAFDTLILDPPRTGAHPKAMKAIEESAPQKIIYMSCNPATFKDNILFLQNYECVSFEAFDMFPQTPHLETLAVFERKG